MTKRDKQIFDALQGIVSDLTEKASAIHDEVEIIQRTGNVFERMDCGKKLGIATGYIESARAICDYSRELI